MQHRRIQDPRDRTKEINWSYELFPWTKEMIDCKDPHWASQKAAQMGISEVLINFAFYAISQLRTPTLYGLPSERPDARDFSMTRFDPAVEMSPYLSTVFQNSTSNNFLKMAGTIPLYIRGSKGGASFHSIPVGALILDEVDKMSDKAVREAIERLSAQFKYFIRQASTPSVPGFGVNRTFELSTQDFYTFKCPCCSRWTEFTFPECLVIPTDDVRDPAINDTYLRCKECGGRIEHEAKPEIFKTAKWQPRFANRNIRGFRISQLYSCALHPARLAEAYLYSLTNPADEQVFYNSKLGQEHSVKGAAVTDDHIKAARSTHLNGCTPTSPIITMGIDVGNFLHVKVMEYKFNPRAIDPNSDSEARLIFFDKIKKETTDLSELDSIIGTFSPICICIDAGPERLISEKFALRHPGRAFTVNYNDHTDGKTLNSPERHKLTVNRTYWIDQYLGRYMTNMIKIPANINEELRVHLKTLQKMFEKNRIGVVIGRYVETEGRDDYAHAGVYCEIALRKAYESGYLGNLKVKV